MKNRYVGLLIIGISILIGLIIYLFNSAMSRIIVDSCTHGPECPMWGDIHLQTNIGFIILGFVLLAGVYIAFFVKDTPIIREVHSKVIVHKQASPKKLDKSHYQRILGTLDPDEQRLLLIILDGEGSVMQSQLVSGTGFTKVKVTRILDRLEGRGIIERKRRGMTNVILLKA